MHIAEDGENKRIFLFKYIGNKEYWAIHISGIFTNE